MANNHQQFLAFNDTIKLSQSKKDELKKNRKELRNIIRRYFRENKSNEIQPKFSSQGSFMMNTTVNPISVKSEDGKKNLYKYDVDDGVYFLGDEDSDDRYSVSTYHDWIYNAVKNHTKTGAQKKDTCVRVLYSDGHHIDLPIYYKRDDIYKSIPELAHKGKQWIDSDPQEFYNWFNEKAKLNKQLKRIVRYLKAWADFKNENSSTKMPPGFILTILAVNNLSHNDRDDICLKETLVKIQNEVDESKGGKFECYRPTTPDDEDLFNSYSEAKKKNFLTYLNDFVTSANQAINMTNPKESCIKWQKHLGNRYSCSSVKDEDEKSNAKNYSSPAVITTNAKSAKC